MIRKWIAKARAKGPRATSFAVCMGLLLALFAVWAIVSKDSFANLWHSIVALIMAIFRYFYVVFSGDVEGARFSNQPLPFDLINWEQIATPVSSNLESFKNYLYSGFRVLTNFTYFRYRMSALANATQIFARTMMLLVSFIPLVLLAFKDYFEPNKKKRGDRSKPLQRFDWIELNVYRPIKRWIVDFFAYMKGTKGVFAFFAVVFIYRYNGFSIVIDFVTYFETFAISWTPVIILKEIASGAVLLWPLILRIGEFGLLVIAYVLFDFIRCKTGVKKLYKFHEQNKKYIDSLGLTVSLVGPPGSGKTMTNSSMTRTQEEMIRQSLNKIMATFRDAFPDFPWMAFYERCRQEILDCVWNSAMIDQWAESFYSKFEKDMAELAPEKTLRADLFGYDFRHKRMTYYDELHVWRLADAIEICAEAYFLYQFPTPLISSNFPQNETFIFKSITAMPSISYKLYEVDFRKKGVLHKSAIIDFNAWRLKNPISGQIDEKTGLYQTGNPNGGDYPAVGCIEGVVYSIQEANKEWTNRNGDGFAQCSKDGTATAISIFRHAATIMNIPMARLFIDSQRLGDTNIGITSKFENELVIAERDREYKSVLFMWIYTRWVQETLIKFHDKIKKRFIENRSDDTLLITIMDRINQYIFDRYTRRKNKYWVIKEKIINIHHTSITTSESSDGLYYILPKDDYSDKYRTDSLKKDIAKMKLRRRGKWNANGYWQDLYVEPAERAKMHSYSTGKLGIDE